MIVSQALVALPKEISVLVLQVSRTPSAFVRALLNNILGLIQSDFGKLGGCLMDAVFPAIMAVLAAAGSKSGCGAVDEHVELSLVQFVFIAFNCCSESRRPDFICMVVPTLCEIVVQKPQPQESPVAMFIGKGMTLLAKTAAEPFRERIMSISENHRSALQNVMRLVIQQQQAAESMAANASAANAPIKKIDMKRYKT
jgi:hypothetical protein